MLDCVDVAIIGGGAAGIAAVRRLISSGYTTLLLEASSRLGGRARTVAAGGHSLDLGCGWLHSAERNPWARIAELEGVEIDRREAAWDSQYLDLGFSPAQQSRARATLIDWQRRLPDVAKSSDRASDALEANDAWNPYVRAICGFSNGVAPDRMSAKDYLAYDSACSYLNWRVPSGLGKLISGSLPPDAAVHVSTEAEAIREDARGVCITTPRGDIRARTAILTVSTNVLAGGGIRLPDALDPWRAAASELPLGHNEKLFLRADHAALEVESHLLGDPLTPLTCDFYIRPFGWPVIECYLGGDSARVVSERGQLAGFTLAIEQLVALFGSGIRSKLKPLAGSDWARASGIRGGYSCALPGRSEARRSLAKAWKEKLFFAGEATSQHDYATAHGAHDSGVRAADEAITVLAKCRGLVA